MNGKRRYLDFAVRRGVNKTAFAGGFCIGGFALHSKYYLAFCRQKSGAKHRGIGWELTFDQWLEFWGDDVSKRGSGKDDLQMQRFADTGPYAVGNVRKGTPKQNSKTKGAMDRNRASAKAAERLKTRRDAMMFQPSAPDYDAPHDLEEETTATKYGNRIGSCFPSCF